jgi:hypothetical protein
MFWIWRRTGAGRAADRKSAAGRRRADGGDDLAAAQLVAAQRRDGGPAERHDALLAALAEDARLVADEVEAGHVEAVQLGEAHAGGVEQLDDGVVAGAAERVLGRSVLATSKSARPRARQPRRQRLLQLGRAHGAGRVRLDDLLAVQVAEEAAHGGELAGDAAAGEAAARQLGEVAAQREAVDAVPAPVVVAAVVAVEEAGELVRSRR